MEIHPTAGAVKFALLENRVAILASVAIIRVINLVDVHVMVDLRNIII